jgi:hypothetical protein
MRVTFGKYMNVFVGEWKGGKQFALLYQLTISTAMYTDHFGLHHRRLMSLISKRVISKIPGPLSLNTGGDNSARVSGHNIS